MKGRRAVAVLALTGLLASGCSTFVDRDQLSFRQDEALELTSEQSVGQTFVARHGGLEAVDVYLSPSRDEPAEIVLHLRSSSLSTTDILTTGLEVAPASQPGFHQFAFPPIQQSHGQYYYAVLEQRGGNVATVPTGVLDSYADGTAYADGVPQSSQLAFRLVYDPVSIVQDLLGMVLGWAAYGLLAMAILFLCGYALIRGWATRNQTDFTADLIVGSIAALSAWMVLLVWLSVARVRLSALSVRVLVGVAASVGLFLFFRDGTRWRDRRTYWLGDKPWATLALWAAVTLSIGLRLFVGRGLVMLPGSDTYHHTLIAQLFEEQGGIPRNYEPYAPLVSFSYHFGFHSIVALFRWLLGTELLLTTKNVALVLNGAIAATVGLLAERMASSRRAGFIAATIVGLVAVSPFCLLRWGRFTQTTGLLFLAAAIIGFAEASNRRGWTVCLLMVPAVILSHYRVAVLLVAFGVILSVVATARRECRSVKIYLASCTAAVILVVPWIVNVALVQSDPTGLRIEYPVGDAANDLERVEQTVLTFGTNVPLAVGTAAVAALFWARERHESSEIAVALWALVLVARVAIPFRVGVASSFLDRTTTLLSLTVPLAGLCGLGADVLWCACKGRTQSLLRLLAGCALALGVLVSVRDLPDLVYGGLFYLRQGDRWTMEWIQDHTSENATFLTSGLEFDWSPGWMVGVDAGYWVPLLTGRRSLPPPMIYSLEWSGEDVLSGKLDVLGPLMLGQEIGVEDGFDRVLRQNDVTHIFVDTDGRLVSALALQTATGATEVYAQDRTTILLVD
jgi:hypothetical protein